MKKLFTLITAAMLFITSFAHDGKNCGKDKKCTKEEMAKCQASAKKDCCKKSGRSALVKASKATKPAPASKKA